ncbi:MAG: hypothetical protein OXG81_04165 [Acidobacteria bacterium]|nr:hypothetical protein [Acidobacteriota bacterium]
MTTESAFAPARPGSPSPPWLAALPPLLAGLAMNSLASLERDAQVAAEGRYIAFAATAVLLAAAGAARRPLSAAALALPVLTVVTFAAVPPGGPGRAAAAGALLCLGPAVLLVDSLLAHRVDLLSPPGSLEPARLLRLGGTLLSALIGLNLLLRQGEMLDGGTLRLLVVLVGIPAVAAVVLTALFARLGAPALAGTAALILAAGGLRSNVVLVLAAAALADAAARALKERWSVAAAALGLGLTLVLGLVLFREPAFGVLLAAMAAAVVWRRFAFAIVLVLAGALALALPPTAVEPWPLALAGVPLILLAAPNLVGRGDLHTVATAALLTVAGLRFLPPQQSLLAAIALWTMLSAARPRGASADDPPPTWPWQGIGLRGDAAVFGFCWQGSLLVFATLSATYPWLRDGHIDDRLSALGLDTAFDRWLGLAVLILIGRGIGAIVKRAPTPRPIVLAVGAVVLTSAALGSWGAFLPRQTLLSSPRQVLTADQPLWAADAGGCDTLMLDTAVAHGGGVAVGQTVARIGAEGTRHTLDLNHGDHTGEWSARQSGTAAGTGPWLHWVTTGPDGPFFGTRYRTEVDIAPLCGLGNLVLVRDSDLPTEVEVILFHALHVGRATGP